MAGKEGRQNPIAMHQIVFSLQSGVKDAIAGPFNQKLANVVTTSANSMNIKDIFNLIFQATINNLRGWWCSTLAAMTSYIEPEL